MSRNATTGVYSAPSNSWNPAVAGTVIDPDDWNDTQTDYVAGLNSLPHFADAGSLNDTSGNELLSFTVTASAVNNVNISNAATGNGPTISPVGGNTDIDLNLAGKGTGVPKIAGGAIYYTGGPDVSAADGGTGISSYTIGDIIYASGATTLAKLAGVATGNALISGGVGAAPSWGKIGLTTHVSGTLPVDNGGSGRTSHTAYAVICGGTTSTGAQQSIASVGTSAQVLTSNGAGALPTMQSLADCIEFVIDGGGSTITTGVKGDLEIPYNCTITRATLLGDQSGSIVIDIWSDTYANYPPTDADSITASAPPTISTATKSQDSTLTGWTTSLTSGSTLRFNVDSVTSLTRVTLSLKVTRTSVS